MYFVFSLFSPLCTDSRFFDRNYFAVSRKKDRAAFAGGPSQGGNAPGEGSDRDDLSRTVILANQKSRRVDEPQFPPRFEEHLSLSPVNRILRARSANNDGHQGGDDPFDVTKQGTWTAALKNQGANPRSH